MSRKLSRREFIRDAAIGAAGVSLLGTGAIHIFAAETAESAPASGPVSGVFSASAQGNGGAVTVTLTIDADQLTDVSIEGPYETEGIGSRAIALMPDSMLTANAVDVDGIAGATQTSNAILRAAAEALALSGAVLLRQEAAIKQHMRPGVYLAEGYGKWPQGSIEGARYGSPAVILPTQVAVTVSEADILEVELIDSSDTPDFVAACKARIPAAIVAQQSVNVDAVTGCTFTSNCILSCVTRALEEAGADIRGFIKVAPKEEGEEILEADICIVGAGGGGTAAALTATEQGKSVVVLEKCGRIGGNTAWATGPMSVGSWRQIEAGSTVTADELFPIWMEYSNWKCNASLVHNILNHSGPTMDWLQDYWDLTDDEGFTKVPDKNGTEMTWTLSKGIHKFTALYEQILYDRGVKLLTETKAEHLLLSSAGLVEGVTAVRQNGTAVIVKAPVVIIGTGGFAGNREMLAKYAGSDNFYVKGLTTSSGDGIRMALEAGSALHNEISVALASFCASTTVDIYSGYLKYCNQIGCLMVDPSGERFMNEEYCVSLSLQAGGSAMRRVGYFYVIMAEEELSALNDHGIPGIVDEETVSALGYRPRVLVDSMPTIWTELQQMLDAGEAWKADTLETLGQITPMDAGIFAATIAEYNEVAASGVDALYGKCASLLRPLAQGPFYAIRVIPAIDGTLNGCRVNKSLQDMGQDLNPIPGLYVVGQDSGGYFSNPYTEYVGSTSCYALTSGRIAGAHASEYLDNL